MRLIQHKREALWFYRFLSLVYDRVNTLFWTPEMRARALDLAALDHADLDSLDVGAGTGFTTEARSTGTYRRGASSTGPTRRRRSQRRIACSARVATRS